jgi:maleylacetoacetate isomerase
MKLYGHFPSSAAFRVRIALNFKGLPYENVFVNLRKNEHHSPEYARVNPQQAVPTLIDGDRVLTQSLSIIEYLEETHPSPPLLPAFPSARARVRAMALLIACDIHPLDNLRVLRYLLHVLKVSNEAKDLWYQHWITEGLRPLETMLSSDPQTGAFCHGDTPTLADVCLIPQIFNAQRVGMDLKAFPTAMRIFDACMKLPAFDRAQPSKQPDAQ